MAKLFKRQNYNIKTQLIEYFEKFATIDFKDITNECEQYSKAKRPIENGNLYQKWLNGIRQEIANEPKFRGDVNYYRKSFLFSCISTENTTSGVYQVFDEDETKRNRIQDKIKDVVFGKVVLMNSCAIGKAKKNISIPSSAFKGYINGFVNKLNEIDGFIATGDELVKYPLILEEQIKFQNR